MAIDTKRVYKHFVGMDAYREKVLQEVRQVASKPDMYSQPYINKLRKEKLEELKTDRLTRANNAKEEIELIRQELSIKQFKDPYDDIQEPIIKPEHKLLAEMQHARKLDLLKAELQLAETPNDIKKVIEQYGEYENFYKHIDLEIKKRSKGENGAKFEALQLELNKEPEEFTELVRLESSLTTLGNMDMHPKGLENGILTNIEYESII